MKTSALKTSQFWLPRWNPFLTTTRKLAKTIRSVILPSPTGGVVPLAVFDPRGKPSYHFR